MMYSPNVQLVKWALPAVALIIGLFWYRRRRIHKADPGGVVESDCQDKVEPNLIKENDMSLYNNTGIQETDEPSFSTNCCMQQETPARVLRKVSESMDIPVRKSPLQSSCDNSQTWCTDVEYTYNTGVQLLSSNPSTNYFETIITGNNVPPFIFDYSGNVAGIYEEVTEENQCTVHSEPSEQNDAVAGCIYTENSQIIAEYPQDAVQTQGQTVYERDSANHSPISGVLEGSVADEARSEGSADSGKGGSIKECKNNITTLEIYYFTMPQNLVGRLIGRHGSFLHAIRSKAEVSIYVNDHPTSSDQKICSIEGNANGINVALDMIRKKFPEKKFPDVTLAEISSPEVIPIGESWIPPCRQMFLADGINNDISICHIVKPNWFFVQLSTNPTFPLIQILDVEMTHSYNSTEALLPTVLQKDMIYVAHWHDDSWARACMVQPDPLGERHTMQLLDFGGYYEFSTSQLRNIKPEHLSVPFQAIEVFLANVQPKNGMWDMEAYHVLAHICFGIVGQAQVEGYIDSNVYANIFYNVQNYGVISLADELIARGFAERVTLEEIVSESVIQLHQESHQSS